MICFSGCPLVVIMRRHKVVDLRPEVFDTGVRDEVKESGFSELLLFRNDSFRPFSLSLLESKMDDPVGAYSKSFETCCFMLGIRA